MSGAIGLKPTSDRLNNTSRNWKRNSKKPFSKKPTSARDSAGQNVEARFSSPVCDYVYIRTLVYQERDAFTPQPHWDAITPIPTLIPHQSGGDLIPSISYIHGSGYSNSGSPSLIAGGKKKHQLPTSRAPSPPQMRHLRRRPVLHISH